jgi:hypothetical protein
MVGSTTKQVMSFTGLTSRQFDYFADLLSPSIQQALGHDT